MNAKKTLRILLNTIPILIMIGLIPFIQNDYLLVALYAGIIILSLVIRYTKFDYLTFFIGTILMTVSEYLFVSTGVETFVRHSLFGIMPVWLPILWGYGFITIKRAVTILNEQ